jgi:uncharacterized protein YyaL (SSP411 family)
MSNFHFSPRANRAHEINWHEWNDSAFAEAQTEDKPILLGISAVWCHWCHVMDETSYSDPGVIRLINERFVPIRVDNDQRPDVNRRYNLGGWPTTAFLTPQGELLTGGTYIPPEQMRGYLTQISQVYKDSKQDILQKIAAVNDKRASARGAAADGVLSSKIVDNVLQEVHDNFDPLYGGFGDEPKFPHPEAIELALEHYFRSRDETWLQVATLTLTKMASGGTYDQQAGGFFRYSTTRDWSVPHFEKMLEDNAKLLGLLVRARQVTHDELFQTTIRSLTAYVDATLSDAAHGGFYGSQDADEHYYTLTRVERARLPAPYVDRAFYTDWNSLMVSAYLETGDQAQREFALKTLGRLWNEMYRADTGLCHFSKEGGPPQLPGQLSDLARAVRAFLDAYQATGDPVHLTRAQTLADAALATCYDGIAGAFWSEPPGAQDLGLLRVPDKALNENAAMTEGLTRLYRLTGDEPYRAAAEKTLASFAADYAHFGFTGAEYALAVDHFLNEPVTIHIVGAAAAAPTRELHSAALSLYAPAKIVQLLDPARDAARLAQLGYPAEEGPLAYVCAGRTCLAPVGDAAGIAKGIKELTTT